MHDPFDFVCDMESHACQLEAITTALRTLLEDLSTGLHGWKTDRPEPGVEWALNRVTGLHAIVWSMDHLCDDLNAAILQQYEERRHAHDHPQK